MCERCKKALGHMRVSADLSGPHPKAVGTAYTYLCVAVFHTEKKTNLPCVRGLPNKTAKEVAEAIHSVLAELSTMAGEQLVVRFHTDAISEFWNRDGSG
eukprot:12901359-Prorocentrum_lima.AAC.1